MGSLRPARNERRVATGPFDAWKGDGERLTWQETVMLPLKPSSVSLLSLALAWAPGVLAQETERVQVTITGNVVDSATRLAIAGVRVSLGDMSPTAVSDTAGRFTLDSIPVGTYQLHLSHQGYHRSVRQLTIVRDGEFVAEMVPLDVGQTTLLTGVVGEVVDGIRGRGIADVMVRPGVPGIEERTNARGKFALTDLQPGEYVVEFTHLGYVPRTEPIQVQTGRVTRLRVSLAVDPLQVDPIEVSVERREAALEAVGFYDREHDGFGEFIDRMEIEDRARGKMTDVFSRVIGATIVGNPNSPIERYVMLRSGRSDGCFPRVLIDGILMHDGGNTPAEIDRFISPATVAGVEVYKSSAGLPVQYGGTNSSCGVILIWTTR